MTKDIHRQYGIRIPAPELEPQEDIPEPVTLPPDHPCCNCTILELKSGVPYCFLPHCDKDIFLNRRFHNDRD